MPSVKELAARIERSNQQREAAAAASLSPPRRRSLGSPGRLGSPRMPAEVLAAAAPRSPTVPASPPRRRSPQPAAASPRSIGSPGRAPPSPPRRPSVGAAPSAPPPAHRAVGAAPPSPPRRPSVDAPPSPHSPADRVGGAPDDDDEPAIWVIPDGSGKEIATTKGVIRRHRANRGKGRAPLLPTTSGFRQSTGGKTDLDARITRRLGELAAARSPSTSPQHKRRPAAPPSPTAKDLVARIERATRERAAAAAAASPPRRRRSLDAAPPSPPRPPPANAPPAPAPARDPTAIAQPLLDALTHLEAAKTASPSLLAALWSGFDAAPPPAPPDPRAPSPPKSLASGGRVGALEAPESLLHLDAHRGRRTSRRRRSSARDAAAAAPVATLPEPVGGLDDDASDVERAAAEDELRLLRHPLCSTK